MGPPPVVTGISPKEGPPGTRVTIRGEFLGTSATDLFGLKICGCDCLLSAEWKSKNKIVARSGPCKGRGDIIVTTKSGGEGTSTVQFRGYHESVGPVKESAVWVEESMPPALPWGRRPMSPTAYTPPDPLGLSTEGEDGKFPVEDLHEMFPDGSGNMEDENFEPAWYLLEHYSNSSYEDLKAGMLYLQRKVESQKEGQLSYLKNNTGSVMDQLDRLVLLKNMFEDDERKNGREPLPSLQAAIEESITLAESLFSDILTKREHADKTREALALLTRHKFLFQLPASIDKNIKRKEYDLVVNDYARVKNLFGNTDVKLFQKILTEIDKKVEDLKEKLYSKMKTMPITIQEQRKFISLLVSLNWEGDAGWVAINSRKDYLIYLLNKVKEHFKRKEDLENIDKGKRKKESEWEGEWSATRSKWCLASCGVISEEVSALWAIAKWYFAGELPGVASVPTDRHDEFKGMIISAVQLFSEHMRACLLTGGGSISSELLKPRLLSNLRNLREAYDTLLKIDLPSQPLVIVEKVIFDYRVHSMTVFLQRAVKRVKALGDKETWKIEEFSDYGAITNLPHLLESCMSEVLISIVKCVAVNGRRESALFSPSNEVALSLQRHSQQMMLAYVNVLHSLALMHADEDFINSSLSVALDQPFNETLSNRSCLSEERGPTWQQKLLIAGTNALYTRRVILPNIANLFESYEFPKPLLALQATKDALITLESTIAETYLEHKGDPLVGTIEPSMYMGRHQLDPDSHIEDARPYLYEIINNLIAVHAEVDSVCGVASSRYIRDICETVAEELSRLAAASPAPRRALAFLTRLEIRFLRIACASHLTRKAENYLMEALSNVPPLETDQDIQRMEKLVETFKKRMEIQIASLNCNMETV